MKITLDVPKVFEGHFATDRFKDSLERLKADSHCLSGTYEKELVDMLIKAFECAVPITENGWIDCADRLPNESGLYLIRCPAEYMDEPDEIEIRLQNFDAECQEFGDWIQEFRDGGCCGEDFYSVNVIAWMPLPEYYEGE